MKVLDACYPPFNHYWVLAAGLTDVAVRLECGRHGDRHGRGLRKAAGPPLRAAFRFHQLPCGGAASREATAKAEPAKREKVEALPAKVAEVPMRRWRRGAASSFIRRFAASASDQPRIPLRARRRVENPGGQHRPDAPGPSSPAKTARRSASTSSVRKTSRCSSRSSTARHINDHSMAAGRRPHRRRRRPADPGPGGRRRKAFHRARPSPSRRASTSRRFPARRSRVPKRDSALRPGKGEAEGICRPRRRAGRAAGGGQGLRCVEGLLVEWSQPSPVPGP